MRNTARTCGSARSSNRLSVQFPATSPGNSNRRRRCMRSLSTAGTCPRRRTGTSRWPRPCSPTSTPSSGTAGTRPRSCSTRTPSCSRSLKSRPRSPATGTTKRPMRKTNTPTPTTNPPACCAAQLARNSCRFGGSKRQLLPVSWAEPCFGAAGLNRLAGVQDAGRVEELLDPALQFPDRFLLLQAQPAQLVLAHAVLPRDGAAHREGHRDGIVQGGAEPLHGRGSHRVAGPVHPESGVQVAVAGVRHHLQLDLVPYGHGLKLFDVVHQPRARHGDVLADPVFVVHVHAAAVAAQLHELFGFGVR